MRITRRSSSAARCSGMAASTVRCRFCARLRNNASTPASGARPRFRRSTARGCHRWHFLPHSPLWMAASLLLLVAGIVGRLMETDDLVGSLRRRHARLDDDRPAVRDVCVAVRSQRPAGHRPVVAHAKPASLPRADRLAAPGAAHCAVLAEICEACRCRKGSRLSTSPAIPGRHLCRRSATRGQPHSCSTGGGTERSFWSESRTAQPDAADRARRRAARIPPGTAGPRRRGLACRSGSQRLNRPLGMAARR